MSDSKTKNRIAVRKNRVAATETENSVDFEDVLTLVWEQLWSTKMLHNESKIQIETIKAAFRRNLKPLFIREEIRRIERLEDFEVLNEDYQLNELSDDRIIELTKYKMDDFRQKQFAKLLEKQQEETLSESEQETLDILMVAYDEGLLIKSEALCVAVERGLIEPLSK